MNVILRSTNDILQKYRKYGKSSEKTQKYYSTFLIGKMQGKALGMKKPRRPSPGRLGCGTVSVNNVNI